MSYYDPTDQAAFLADLKHEQQIATIEGGMCDDEFFSYYFDEEPDEAAEGESEGDEPYTKASDHGCDPNSFHPAYCPCFACPHNDTCIDGVPV